LKQNFGLQLFQAVKLFLSVGNTESFTIMQGLGMDAAQCGFLIGVRPIIEYLATPFWHGMSDRFCKRFILYCELPILSAH
jgi:hypothetical protein